MRLPDRICFITDRNLSRSKGFKDLYDVVATALDSGIRWIQYREKDESRAFIFHWSLRLRELTFRYNAALTVNDHTDIAVAIGADGIHLGQEDLPIKEARRIADKKFIGISTHFLSEAITAEGEGADYIGFGPVFMTETKDAGPAKGLELLKEIKRNVKIPVVAIGGINAGNISSVFEAGADAVAIASGLLSGDMERNIKLFRKITGGL
ncbi:MAG: thiamine phosphate synthase [Thermodesulfovibrionales bacterium]